VLVGRAERNPALRGRNAYEPAGVVVESECVERVRELGRGELMPGWSPVRPARQIGLDARRSPIARSLGAAVPILQRCRLTNVPDHGTHLDVISGFSPVSAPDRHLFVIVRPGHDRPLAADGCGFFLQACARS
jgi:hypothetical protein